MLSANLFIKTMPKITKIRLKSVMKKNSLPLKRPSKARVNPKALIVHKIIKLSK